MARTLRGFTDAVTFLTVVPVPVPVRSAVEGFDLGPALPWFPVVGAVVGAAGGGVRVAFDSLLGAGPSTALALATMVAITGALHQDALADTFDGLGVRGDRDRRLAVMRDSTLGAFGVLAIVLWALTEFAALDALSAKRVLWTLIAAGAVSRMTAVLHGLLARPARSDGLGATLRVSATATGCATVVAFLVCLAATGLARAGLALGVGVAVAAVTAAGARRAIGGSTGDTLGASVAIAETAVCLALLASWR